MDIMQHFISTIYQFLWTLMISAAQGNLYEYLATKIIKKSLLLFAIVPHCSEHPRVQNGNSSSKLR